MTRNIMILVTTYNNINDIENTLVSIWNQDYSQKNIYTCVVDFGSTDGTYEKVLQYSKDNLAIFSLSMKRPGSTRVMEAAKLMYTQSPGGMYAYRLLLQPGDILYENCLSKCVEASGRHEIDNSGLLLLNTDVKLRNGEIKHQKPLSQIECSFNEAMSFDNIDKKVAQHYTAWFGKDFSLNNHRNSGLNNERCFFSKAQMLALEHKVIYIPDILLCLAERIYDDEFDEILLRWESNIRLQLTYKSKYKIDVDQTYINNELSGLAYYCLWRGCKRYYELNQEQLENIVLIAELIYPEITKTSEYIDIYDLIINRDIALFQKCCSYFE